MLPVLDCQCFCFIRQLLRVSTNLSISYRHAAMGSHHIEFDLYFQNYRFFISLCSPSSSESFDQYIYLLIERGGGQHHPLPFFIINLASPSQQQPILPTNIAHHDSIITYIPTTKTMYRGRQGIALPEAEMEDM